MPTAVQIQSLMDRIYNASIAGTPTNPRGLPPALSNLVVSQARHETNNFTSNSFVKFNNGFGYKYTGNKWQSGMGVRSPEGDFYAAYANIENSTREIVDWIYRRMREGKFPANLGDIRTPEQYATLLKNAGYYGDDLENYIAGLKRWLKKVTEAIPWASVFSFASIATIGYMLIKKKKTQLISV